MTEFPSLRGERYPERTRYFLDTIPGSPSRTANRALLGSSDSSVSWGARTHMASGTVGPTSDRVSTVHTGGYDQCGPGTISIPPTSPVGPQPTEFPRPALIGEWKMVRSARRAFQQVGLFIRGENWDLSWYSLHRLVEFQ